MKCNTNLILPIISIIIIVGIITLILYKNMEDNDDISHTNHTNHTNHENPVFIEPFNVATPEIIQKVNNMSTSLNILIDKINNSPTILNSIDSPSVIQNILQKDIGDNIQSSTEALAANYMVSANNYDNNIAKLETNVSDLENVIANMNKSTVNKNNYTSIKSLNNGLEMKLLATPNTVFKDEKTGETKHAYMVNVNGGCLSVSANSYDIYKCNDKNSKQYFKLENILNDLTYNNNIDKALPFDNSDKTNINYPFAMIKSTNNENCLTNNHGNITVQPCYSFVAQRWMPLL